MTDSIHLDPTAAAGQKSLRQLAHDFRTPLSVICMGLEALKHVRHDEQQFDELLRMMVSEGTERLKALISEMSGEKPSSSTSNRSETR